MKKIKIYVCLFVALLLLDSCVQVCVESEKNSLILPLSIQI